MFATGEPVHKYFFMYLNFPWIIYFVKLHKCHSVPYPNCYNKTSFEQCNMHHFYSVYKQYFAFYVEDTIDTVRNVHSQENSRLSVNR